MHLKNKRARYAPLRPVPECKKPESPVVHPYAANVRKLNGDPLPSGESPVRMQYYVKYPSYPGGGIYDLSIEIWLVGSRTERETCPIYKLRCSTNMI